MFVNCPLCKLPMKRLEYEGIDIDSCDKCGGNWLDRDELKKVIDIREVRFSAEELRAVAEAKAYPGLPQDDLDRGLSCPACDSPMQPLNYGGGSGLILDKCTGCGGFWLDDTELEKVQTLVEGWEDALDDDLAKHSKHLHAIEWGTEAIDPTKEVQHSQIPIFGPFINAVVNGIFNLGI